MADSGITLVAGATGTTGSGVAASLLAEGRPVRALARDERKAEALRKGGAEVERVDLDRPETLSDDLFDDVDRVYFVTWNGSTAYDQSRNLLDAIVRSGASPHIVRLSAFGSPKSRIIVDLVRCEEDLKASGLPWTILKPTFFMQNVLMSAATARDHGVLYYDWADGKAAMVDMRDIVDCAVAALLDETGSTRGQSYVLTGPEPIGFAEVAETLSQVLGREVEYVAVPHEAASEAMLGMGIPEWIVKGYAELSAGFAEGFADLTTDDVERLSGHEPRSFEQFARDFADALSGVSHARA